jgi:predicted NBD/HSP70 family sugar kinase
MRYEDMEYENFKNVLGAIDELKDPSRAMIAKHLSLSRTTLTNMTSVMIEKKILVEGETKHNEASRGRPGATLRYCDDTWFALGAAFYSSSWNFVICSLSGKIVQEYTLQLENVTPEELVSKLLEGIEYMISCVPGQILPGIGIGAPGVVNSEAGAILWAYDLKWFNSIDLKRAVKARFGLEAYCLNRYTLAGLAEFKYANPEGERNMVYVGLGSGIRSAIFINGKLIEGASYSAGRIGHIPIDPNGPLCECGKHGCLLAMANEQALLAHAKAFALLPEYEDSPLSSLSGFTVSDIISYADTGDPCAMRAMDKIIEPIITAIAILVDIVNPKKIVLGGPIGYSSLYLAQRVEEAANRIAAETPYRVMSIVPGKLKENGSALGAAALVLDKKCDLLYSLVKN